jgi:hypothetical protein
VVGAGCEVANPAYDPAVFPGDSGMAGTVGESGGAGGAGGSNGVGGVGGSSGSGGNLVDPGGHDDAATDAPTGFTPDAIVLPSVDAATRDVGLPEVTPGVCPDRAVVDWSWWDFQSGGLLHFANGQLGSGANGAWSLIADMAKGGDTASSAGLSIPGGRNGSTSGIRYQLTGYGGWGAGIAGRFSPVANDTWSLNEKRGIRFFARVQAGGPTTITFRLVTRPTDPTQGICTTCKGHFETTVAVNGVWQEYFICFAELVLSPGKVVPQPTLDLSVATGVQFVSPPSSVQREIWIDDIAAFR